MRSLLGIAFLALMLQTMGCASPQLRAERAAMTKKAVAESLENKHLRIDVRSMSTFRYGSRTVSDGFYLELKGDTLESYLPYLGQVYQGAAISPSEGLNFVAPIMSYHEAHPKKGLTRIEMKVKTKEDFYDYILEIYDTGTAFIRVRGQNRDSISFDGDCVV